MITKESKAVKKCCLYASDFHLEMILLPYIKERINKSNFIIITQNDLSETIKILLNRVNINKEDRKKILDIDWTEYNGKDFNYIKESDYIEIIINGNNSFIEELNDRIKSLNNKINIVNCYNINDKELNINSIKNNYEDFLNTTKL